MWNGLNNLIFEQDRGTCLFGFRIAELAVYTKFLLCMFLEPKDLNISYRWKVKQYKGVEVAASLYMLVGAWKSLKQLLYRSLTL
jgi:hypothetical protein